MSNYYNILGVNNTATEDDIKKAYRKLAKEHHPDVGGDANKFKQILEAYEVLSDVNKRRQYDNSFNRQSHSFNDIFDFDLNSIFGNRSYSTSGFNVKRQKGDNLRITINITLEDVLFGSSKRIKLNRKVKCEPCKGVGGSGEAYCNNCGGKGMVMQRQQTTIGILTQSVTCPLCLGTGKTHQHRCNTCNSNGYRLAEEIVDINIPEGCFTGLQYTLGGKGNYIKNGDYGDLIVEFNEIQHNKYKRDRNNVVTTIIVPVLDAILGAKYELKYLDGSDIVIDVPKGTSDGYIIKFNNKGIKDINYNIRGDLNVYIKLKIPTNLSDEEINIVKQLKNLDAFK